MKKIFNIIMVACIAVVAACTQEIVPLATKITVDQQELSFDGKDAKSVTVKVTADGDWLTNVPEWVVVNPAFGTGNMDVTITAKDNLDPEKPEELYMPREGVVTFVASEETAVVAVKQAGDESKIPDYPTIEAGEYWMCFNVSGKWLATQPLSSGYGYLNVEDAVKSGSDVLSTAANAFTFTAVEGKEAVFTIQDAEGQYYYQSGTYNSFNRTKDKPAEGAEWEIRKINDEGSIKILNLSVSKFAQYDAGYNSVGSYSDEKGILPMLIEVKIIPDITLPESVEVLGELTSTEVGIEATVAWKATVEGGATISGAAEGEGDGSVVITFPSANNGTEPIVYTLTVEPKEASSGAKATSVEIKHNPAELHTIAEAITLDMAHVQGQISAICTEGYILTDETASIYVRHAAGFDAAGYAIGDKMDVAGLRTGYNFAPQLDPAQENKLESGTFTQPAPKEIGVVEIVDYSYLVKEGDKTKDMKVKIENVSVTGKLTAGKYINLYVAGAESRGDVSVYKPLESLGIESFDGKNVTIEGYVMQVSGSKDPRHIYVIVNSIEEAAEIPDGGGSDDNVKTLTNAEILAALETCEGGSSYVEYDIASASGTWKVNASPNKTNTYLQCRGKKGGYIKTPAFDKDIKSVTLHFSIPTQNVKYSNPYAVFPSTWTVPTEDAAYPDTDNVGIVNSVSGESFVTIPVNAGNKQVYISIIGTYSYYLDHIDVEF